MVKWCFWVLFFIPLLTCNDFFETPTDNNNKGEKTNESEEVTSSNTSTNNEPILSKTTSESSTESEKEDEEEESKAETLSVCETKSWKLIDDYLYGESKSSKAQSLVVGNEGELYVAGMANGKILVRKSTDGGAIWENVHEIAQPEDEKYYLSIGGLAINKDGDLYLANTSTLKPAEGSSKRRYYWQVQKSEDGGKSWKQVDEYHGEGEWHYAGVKAIAATDEMVFAGGYAQMLDEKDGLHKVSSLIRLSKDGGQSWTTVDSFPEESDNRAIIESVGFDEKGNLYSFARYEGIFDEMSLLVRQSKDKGSTWQTHQIYKHTGTFLGKKLPMASDTVGFAHDGQGDLYIAIDVGAEAANGWLLKKGSETKNSFEKVYEKLVKGPTEWQEIYSRPEAIHIDHEGTLWVAGKMEGEWLILKSSDKGKTFKSTYEWKYDESDALSAGLPEDEVGNFDESAMSLGSDKEGNLYVVGFGQELSGKSHWIVKKWGCH